MQRSSEGDADDSSISKVEGDVIEAFLALTLKLSLDDFKPLFYRVFNISTVDQGGTNVIGCVTEVSPNYITDWTTGWLVKTSR